MERVETIEEGHTKTDGKHKEEDESSIHCSLCLMDVFFHYFVSINWSFVVCNGCKLGLM